MVKPLPSALTISSSAWSIGREGPATGVSVGVALGDGWGIGEAEGVATGDGEIAGEGRAGDTGVTGLLPPPQARANATVAS